MSSNIEFERNKLKAQQMYPEKELIVGYALLFFAGILGAHRFYYGKIITGILMLLFTILVVTIPITFIWCLVDIYFVHKYNEEQNRASQLKQLSYIEKLEDENKKL